MLQKRSCYKGKSNKGLNCHQSYLWLDKIIILEIALFLNFVKFFFHKLAKIICATAEIYYLQDQWSLGCS